MVRVLLDGQKNSRFQKEFLRFLKAYVFVSSHKILFEGDAASLLVSDGVHRGTEFDIVVLGPQAKGDWALSKDGIVLFDGADKESARLLRSVPCRAVSCGFSEKDTITVSSCQNGKVSVFVQREIPFKETKLEIGEFVLEHTGDKFGFANLAAGVIQSFQ